MNDRIRPHSRRTAGQSLVEFAVLLPVMLTLFGAAVDVARVYQAWITLEASTRDAAEYVATYDTTDTAALSDATTRICTQLVNIPGRTGSASDPAVCTQPAVTATVSVSTTATGASTRYPIATANIVATFPFRTLFPYPLFTQNGAWTLTSRHTYSIIQGR